MRTTAAGMAIQQITAAQQLKLVLQGWTTQVSHMQEAIRQQQQSPARASLSIERLVLGGQ